jgi:hypothetical protein
MKSVRAMSFMGLVFVAAGAAWAAGVNDVFDLNRDGSQGLIQDLTDDKASFTKEGDLVKFDKAIEKLQAAPHTGVTTSVKAFQAALAKLAKLQNHEEVTPDLQEAVDTLYFQVYGLNAQGGASASNYYAGKPVNIKNARALFSIVKAVTGRITKLESTQGAGSRASQKPAQKLALYLSVCKASDALIKRFGAVN